MRKDMFKVIVERPRPGSRYMSVVYHAYRRAKKFKLDENFDCVDEFTGLNKLPMKGKHLHWERKRFNENLNPLRRFIEKSVGRRWDDVFSEICETLDTNSTIKQHVRQHVPDFIVINAKIEDGVTYSRDSRRWYSSRPLHKGDLYVHPDTRIVCRIEESVEYPYHIEAAARRAEERQRIRHFDKDGNYVTHRGWKKTGEKEDGIYFEKIDNTWFKFIFVLRDRTEERVETRGTGTVVVYRHYKERVKTKITASKKEIRDYGLNKPLI